MHTAIANMGEGGPNKLLTGQADPFRPVRTHVEWYGDGTVSRGHKESSHGWGAVDPKKALTLSHELGPVAWVSNGMVWYQEGPD